VLSEQLAGMRVDYEADVFDVDTLAPTWYEQLDTWLIEAQAAGLPEVNAMVLATAGPNGLPSSRTVLCKALDEHGVVFYTNYTSAKSHDLRETPYASATFPWFGIARQVHLRGPVEVTSPEETEAYWVTRPRGAQLGAWASAQSTVVRDRRTLDDALAGVAHRFEDDAVVPLPQHWGGWRIRPEQVEFWQGRSNRMHDRLRFGVDPVDRRWSVRRLAP